jgi:arylsulfatase A-like enzyme/Tfp pilus assembly protein PilF
MPGISRRRLGFLAFSVLAASAGCRGGSGGAPNSGRPNILLVTIDTLRADHLGCYGRREAATPALDALAARGVRFETAVSHVPLTGPSHASILTGRTPLGHGFRDNGGYVLPAEARTAAEGFRDAGYRTAAFVSGFPLDRRFGFDRGFELYDDHLPRGNDRRRTPYVERFADATTDAALRWLGAPAAGRAAAPWFVWVHYYDPHAPYEPPGELAERFRASPYDGEIAFVDRQIARLLGALEEKREAGRTVVLVTADHGESLGEHGEKTHGLFVYDSTLRVPWLMAGPDIQRGRVASTVARGIDVLPTLADYAGLTLAGMEGRSLRPAVNGRTMDDAPAYAESLYPEREFGWASLHAWRTARYKLIEAPRPELYDLVDDAGETRNRVAEDAAQADALGQKLRSAMSRPAPSAAADVDPETAERLGALGYVGGGGGGGGGAAAAPLPAGASRRDPKDGVRLLSRLNRGTSTARTDPEGAIRELTAVLAEDPGLLMALRSRAVAYEAAGRHELAIADLRRVEKLGVLGAEGGVVLGDNLRFAGRLDEAMRVLERTARENPKFAQPWLSIAEVHIKQKKNAEAAGDYERVLAIVPDHIEALRGLGDLALLEGKLDAAAARYARILEVDAADGGAMTKLGVVRMQAGRTAEAVALFRQAVQREPTNGEALLYLAGALAAGGQAAEAVPFFERALAAGSRTTMALNGLGLTRLELGDRKGAAEAFRESLKLDPRQPDITQALANLGGP